MTASDIMQECLLQDHAGKSFQFRDAPPRVYAVCLSCTHASIGAAVQAERVAARVKLSQLNEKLDAACVQRCIDCGNTATGCYNAVCAHCWYKNAAARPSKDVLQKAASERAAAAAALDEIAVARASALRAATGSLMDTVARIGEMRRDTPIPMRLNCPACKTLHIDQGEFATKPHYTHSCQHCGLTWRPAVVATVGVRFLPGFRDGDK